ncbi:hypothetical protein DKT68_25250 [Micromonospora acroterricola]|uniref:Uncharacterized protein n=1 Tax=Micromonospora acroterricola TaxID=2202421 RepID=A0A317CTH7_9ACTN|nr:hypothetical protein DKT68_25250 [Micromonospora acroterricola]
MGFRGEPARSGRSGLIPPRAGSPRNPDVGRVRPGVRLAGRRPGLGRRPAGRSGLRATLRVRPSRPWLAAARSPLSAGWLPTSAPNRSLCRCAASRSAQLR